MADLKATAGMPGTAVAAASRWRRGPPPPGSWAPGRAGRRSRTALPSSGQRLLAPLVRDERGEALDPQLEAGLLEALEAQDGGLRERPPPGPPGPRRRRRWTGTSAAAVIWVLSCAADWCCCRCHRSPDCVVAPGGDRRARATRPRSTDITPFVGPAGRAAPSRPTAPPRQAKPACARPTPTAAPSRVLASAQPDRPQPPPRHPLRRSPRPPHRPRRTTPCRAAPPHPTPGHPTPCQTGRTGLARPTRPSQASPTHPWPPQTHHTGHAVPSRPPPTRASPCPTGPRPVRPSPTPCPATPPPPACPAAAPRPSPASPNPTGPALPSRPRPTQTQPRRDRQAWPHHP